MIEQFHPKLWRNMKKYEMQTGNNYPVSIFKSLINIFFLHHKFQVQAAVSR